MLTGDFDHAVVCKKGKGMQRMHEAIAATMEVRRHPHALALESHSTRCRAT